jgi:hypothetical protein
MLQRASHPLDHVGSHSLLIRVDCSDNAAHLGTPTTMKFQLSETLIQRGLEESDIPRSRKLVP